MSSDPWSNIKCGDKKCIICSNPFNTDFSCRKRNVCYKTFCLKCAEDAGVDQKALKSNINNQINFYFGETFRDAFTRGCEHVADYYAKSEDSHMYKHIMDVHPDCKPRDINFGMSVVKKHRSSFERMILEAVLIYRGGQNVLNSRSQYSRCQVPRLSVMVGDSQQFDTAALKIETEKLKKRIVEEAIDPPKKRAKVDGNLKDMKVTSIRDFNSHKSNSVHDDQKEDLAPNSVNDRKRFLNPPKRRPKIKKFDFKTQPPISTFFKPKPNFGFSSSPDQT